jgi:DNA-binding GntR family transcriptional regulator
VTRIAPGPRPVVQTSVVELVIREVRRAILDGSLRPGEPVSIADLSARLNVSHIPVREALRRLEGEGLVELRPSRSAVVAPLTREDLEAIFRLRGTLESDVYARAIGLFTPEDLDELGAAWEALEVRPDDDAESVSERHVAFHRLLARPAASEWDWRLLDLIWQANERYMYLILGEVMQSGRTEFRNQHTPFLEAARAGSRRAMRSAVTEHLRSGIGLIGPALERGRQQ